MAADKAGQGDMQASWSDYTSLPRSSRSLRGNSVLMPG